MIFKYHLEDATTHNLYQKSSHAFEEQGKKTYIHWWMHYPPLHSQVKRVGYAMYGKGLQRKHFIRAVSLIKIDFNKQQIP